MPKLRTTLAVMFLMVGLVGGSVTYARPAGVSSALQPPEPPTISVSGAIRYDTGSAHVPAQGIRVELRDDEEPYGHGPGELLAWTETDDFGRYSFEDIDNRDLDGPERRPAAGQDVRLLILTDNGHVEVQRYPQGSTYNWASDDPDLLGARGLVNNVPDGARVEFSTIQFDDDVEDYQAIRAFVALNDGWSFLVDDMGLPDPGRAVARWPSLTTSARGYYPDQRLIILSTGDADFPDAVMHLEAHAFMDNMLRDLGGTYPPECVVEEPIGVESSQTCAWIHGWGLFFAAAAQNDPSYVTASQALSLESPLVDLDDGDAVSARVAGALWDLMDAANDGFDQYTGSFMELWNGMSSAPVYTFREFWDASGIPACEGLTALAQNTINYNTPPQLDPFPDPIEMDEDPESPPAFDMRTRARDAECSFDKLLFDVEGSATSTVSVELREDGFLEIVPAENWYGEVTANVRVFDGVDFTSQPLHVIVHSVNDAPRIAPPPDRTVRVGEEIVYQLESRISDVDDEKDSLTLSVVPAQEVLVPNLEWEIDQENFIVRFIPRMSGGEEDLRPGTNAVELVVTDPGGAAGRHTLLLTWEPLPNQPPAIASTIPEVWEAHKGQTIEMDLLTYATDDRDEPSELSWTVDFDKLDNATVVGAGTQKLIFTPDPAGFLGDDDITLVVQDRDGRESTVDVILRWTPEPNIAPTINPPIPDFSTGINQQLVVDLSAYGHDQDDNENGLRWYVQFVDPEAPNPFITGQGTQKLTFTPVLNYEGTIEALFVVRDPKGAEASQLVNLIWQQYKVYIPLQLRPFPQKPAN
ncbi:MAG: Ig-like domain-containing protein [Anaerolineae bacterium]